MMKIITTTRTMNKVEYNVVYIYVIIKYLNCINKYLIAINTWYFKNIGTFTCISIHVTTC